MRNTFQVGDLVDVIPAIKKITRGLGLVIDKSKTYYTILWTNGDLTIVRGSKLVEPRV